MKRLVIALAVVGLAGCQTASDSAPTPSAAPVQPVTTAQMTELQPAGSAEVTFLDLSAFDEDLAGSLAERNRTVKVDIPAKFTLNDIPERMEKWLAAIKDSGGKVQAKTAPEPGMATRGLFGVLIDVTVSAVKAKLEADKLASARDYNALITYDKATGQVQDILFTRR
ncbi:MAG: hypothetical protein HQL35_13735 [Alphaproteobacteria bacterium]|nr:hypothetical protein [Alphaproteobacteria bacterium]